MKYSINGNTGAGNYTIIADDLETAQRSADEGACYTQQPVTIHDAETMEVICYRRWWSTAYAPEIDDCINPIEFGSFGFYDDWYEY